MIRLSHMSYRLLSDEQLSDVHNASLQVLESTGVIVEHPKALEMLSSVGCSVIDGNRVKIPADVVNKAIDTAPDSVTVYSRNGTPRMTLKDRDVYFGSVTSLPTMAEADGSRHPFTLNDCREMTIIIDYLDTLDFATGTGLSTDVPPEVSDVHEISCMIQHSSKPVLITNHDVQGLKAIIDICTIHKGNMQAFRAEPFVVYCACPISPLKHSHATIEKMLLAVENGFPFVSVSAPGAGGTSPITLAGTLVCGNAESLSALVIAQLCAPGSPFLYGGFFTTMDMSSAVMTHGSPEFNLLNIAQAELARHYRLPTFSSAGCTDAHVVDAQASFEAGFSTLNAVLGGANMVHAAGVLGSGTAVSKEMLILSDEHIGYVRRFAAGITIDTNTLAVDEIDRVGCGGNFMETDMTYQLYKTEQWFARSFFRGQYENWQKRAHDHEQNQSKVKRFDSQLCQHLEETARNILSSHQPEPVDQAKMDEIRHYIDTYTRTRCGSTG